MCLSFSFSFNIFWQSNFSASHHNIFRTAVVQEQIVSHIRVCLRKLIWHNLSPKNMKIGHINKRNCESLTIHSVSQHLLWKSYKHNVSTSEQRTMGSRSAVINYLRKVCLETVVPSTWIHFNRGSGHICLGTSNPLWVTLSYDIWTENCKEDCSKCVVFGGVCSSTAFAQLGCVVAAII